MNHRLVYLLLFLWTASMYSQFENYSQKQFDSLTALPEIFYEKPFNYWYAMEEHGFDPDTIKAILDANPRLQGLNRYYARQSCIMVAKRNRDSAAFFADQSIKAFEELKKITDQDRDRQGLMYYILGRAASYSRDYEEGVEFTQRAVDLDNDRMQNWNTIFYEAIGRNHYNMENFEMALDYYHRVAEDSVHMANERSEVTINLTIADIYKQLDQLDSAKPHLEVARKTSEEGSYKGNLFAVYNYLAEVYEKEGRTDSMEYYYRKVIETNKEHPIKNPVTMANRERKCLILESYFDIKKGNSSVAITKLMETLDFYYNSEKVHTADKRMFLEAVNLLGKAYEEQGLSNKYGEVLELTGSYLERYSEQLLEENLADLEVKYQTREKDNSIAQLEKNKEQQDAIISQQRIISFGLGGFILVLAGLGILYNKQRKLKAQYVTTNLEQRLLRSQLNPHFIFNALVSASTLANEKSEKTVPYITRFSNLLRLILKNSRQEFVSLDEELAAVENYLELQSDFSKRFTYRIAIDEDIEKECVHIPPMFIQPFIENAIQHGLKGHSEDHIDVNVVLKADEKLVQVTIRDNGIGYSNGRNPAKQKMDNRSYSGDILKERLKIYADSFKTNADYIISELDAGGTEVIITLPYIEEE